MAKKNAKKHVKINLDELSNQSQTLLANIRFASVDEPVKTIVITSSDVDEGKSTTAVALAMAMAKSGKRTLLMDCDMRRRSLAHMLELHPEAGIYSVLSGAASLKTAIEHTQMKNLYFLDCEPNIVNPSDLISTKRFAALMGTLRNTFDYVVVDTPPMQLFVDAAVAGALCDGVIMVIRQRKAKKRAVSDSLVQLQTANCRILGSVLTFAQKGDNDYYYYYAYYNEENKRVSHHGADPTINGGEAPASRREFDEADMDAWARRVGINANAARTVEPGRASRHAAGSRSAARQQAQAQQVQGDQDNPYKPGSFRN